MISVFTFRAIQIVNQIIAQFANTWHIVLGCKARAEHLPHVEYNYLIECISRATKADIIYIRTKMEQDDVMKKGTMLFALTPDDEVAAIHIFQPL